MIKFERSLKKMYWHTKSLKRKASDRLIIESWLSSGKPHKLEWKDSEMRLGFETNLEIFSL